MSGPVTIEGAVVSPAPTNVFDDFACNPSGVDLAVKLTEVFSSLSGRIAKLVDEYSIFIAPGALAGLCLSAESLLESLPTANSSPLSLRKQILLHEELSKTGEAHDFVLSFGAAVIDRVSRGDEFFGTGVGQRLIRVTSEMLQNYAHLWGSIPERDLCEALGRGDLRLYDDGIWEDQKALRACQQFAGSCLELESCFLELPDEFGATDSAAPWRGKFLEIRQLQQRSKHPITPSVRAKQSQTTAIDTHQIPVFPDDFVF